MTIMQKHFFTLLTCLYAVMLVLMTWQWLFSTPDVVLLREPISGRVDLAGCEYPAALVTKTGLVLCNRPEFHGDASVETITDPETGEIVWQQYGRPILQSKGCFLPGMDNVHMVNLRGNICEETFNQGPR